MSYITVEYLRTEGYMNLETLKIIRKGKRIKQTDLARTIGISQTYLSQIENSKRNPSFELIVDWCAALDYKLVAIPKT